jgi:hypothetical protein
MTAAMNLQMSLEMDSQFGFLGFPRRRLRIAYSHHSICLWRNKTPLWNCSKTRQARQQGPHAHSDIAELTCR